MRYQLSITIHKPIKVVTRLFVNRALLSQWQPDLLNSQQIENYPFSKYTHQLAIGRRKILITESIVRHDLPDHYDLKFKLKGITNHTYYSFEEISPDITRMNCRTEYSFSGIMKLISIFMKGSLKKQSEILISNFKQFAESRKG